jgi:DNA-binding response OmpR family regulator
MGNYPAAAHIVVYDDDCTMLTLFEAIFTDEGYRVTGFAAIGEDVDELVQLAPDLIVLDLVFAGRLIGIDFVHRLKDRPAMCAVPILLCTGADVLRGEIQRLIETGQCRYVVKPFDLDTLDGAVRGCLSERAFAA